MIGEEDGGEEAAFIEVLEEGFVEDAGGEA